MTAGKKESFLIGFLRESEAEDFFSVGFYTDDMSVIGVVTGHFSVTLSMRPQPGVQ